MCTQKLQGNEQLSRNFFYTFVVFEQNVRNAQKIHSYVHTETCQENVLYHDFRDSISSSIDFEAAAVSF